MHLLLRLLTNCVLGTCYCVHLFQPAPQVTSSQSSLSSHQTTNKEEAEQAWRAGSKSRDLKGLSCGSSLRRTGSIKDLISKFSGPDHVSSSRSPQSPSSGAGKVALESPKSSPSSPSSVGQYESPVPSITVTPSVIDTSQNEAGSTQTDTKTSQITARIDCPVDGSAVKTSQTRTPDSGRDSVADSGMGSVSKRENSSFDVPA